jgi:hypothetical protein
MHDGLPDTSGKGWSAVDVFLGQIGTVVDYDVDIASDIDTET